MKNIEIYKLVTCCKWSDVIGKTHPTSWQYILLLSIHENIGAIICFFSAKESFLYRKLLLVPPTLWDVFNETLSHIFVNLSLDFLPNYLWIRKFIVYQITENQQTFELQFKNKHTMLSPSGGVDKREKEEWQGNGWRRVGLQTCSRIMGRRTYTPTKCLMAIRLSSGIKRRWSLMNGRSLWFWYNHLLQYGSISSSNAYHVVFRRYHCDLSMLVEMTISLEI